MKVVASLDTLRERGFELYVAAGKVRYRATAGAIDDDLRRAAAEYRGELLALLLGETVAAASERDKALGIIDEALSLPWPSPAQRGVLAALEAVVEMYHARRDPLLFGSPAWIEAYVEGWRAEHEEAIRRN